MKLSVDLGEGEEANLQEMLEDPEKFDTDTVTAFVKGLVKRSFNLGKGVRELYDN